MRLIDADELLERWKYDFDHTRKLEECIKTQPTAFNKENVLQELEKLKQFYDNRMSEMGGTDRDVEDWGAIKRLKDAIEIVKRGGLNE